MELALFQLTLTAEPPQPPAPMHLRGWLYTLLETRLPTLHDQQALKPFSLAVSSASPPTVQLGLLSAQLCDTLSPLLSELQGQPLRLGKYTYTVTQVSQTTQSYAVLLETPGSADAALHFVTPTFFRRSGSNYPLPEPLLVFGSLIQRWNQFAPQPVPDDIANALMSRLTIRYLNLNSVTSSAHARTVGCVGRITFHLPKATLSERQWLSALSQYSRYAGVGAKTTLGFGLVRPYKIQHAPQ
jgi:CRISPR-associated endoribonuclease Cas6